MNVIVIQSDTFRSDHLGCYGTEKVRTPNLNRFAEEAAVFDRNYAASYPTVPNRHDIWTGRYNYLYRGWCPLSFENVTLPDVLGEHGVTSALVFDTPMLVENDFHRDFSAWKQVRGHHTDRFSSDPMASTSFPAEPHKLKKVERVEQYLRNRGEWRYEKDYITARTFTEATEWLEQNKTLEQFFLMVDTWPPHEVFDPPEHYLAKYDDVETEVQDIIYPCYGRPDYMSEEEMRRVRARYAGLVTMVDAWFGQLLDTVDRLGLADETAIVFTSDHGHLFGEHNLWGKPVGGLLGQLYESLIRTPLLIRHPEGIGAGTRVDTITQPPDLMPTILDLLGLPTPESVQGTSLLPLMTGERERIRGHAFTGRFPEGADSVLGDIQAQRFDGWVGPERVTGPVTVTTDKWAYICHPDPSASELYDLEADPAQETNIVDDEAEIAAKLRQAFFEFADDLSASETLIGPFESDDTYEPEALAPETTVYTFVDSAGKRFAHLDADEARTRAPSSVDDQDVTAMTYDTLLERDPTALVYLNRQYYRAEELVGL